MCAKSQRSGGEVTLIATLIAHIVGSHKFAGRACADQPSL
jgi:hypothetical protein